jgi:peroxiredoxin Q/BCP
VNQAHALPLKPGDPAPDFRAPTQTGETLALADLRGRYVVLYFYPKDHTPGCTLEACGFRDRWPALQAAGAVVLGVNADSLQSHERFARRFRLPFPLLADPERRIIRAYGAENPNPLLRWLGLGTRRITYLIGPDGRIVEVWPRAGTAGHAAEVLAALERHRSGHPPAAAS